MAGNEQAIGYGFLINRYGLRVTALRTESFLHRGARRSVAADGSHHEYYPLAADPGPELSDHLTFALKHEGVNLEVLRALFAKLTPNEVASIVRAAPTGKYTRRIWFLFEWLTGVPLDLPDTTAGPYVDLLDSERYVTCVAKPSTRHRVRDNLLGVPDFCPFVRRTEADERGSASLRKLASEVVADYDPGVLARATDYLYLKETRASYEIERERPTQKRAQRFIELLHDAAEPIDRARLIELNDAVLDSRYAEGDYRADQNYVGEVVGGYRQRIHFISPKPGDIETLMSGLLACADRMARSQIDPIVQAAVLSFGFVFIHPFNDGNGRIHRFLIHHVLSRTGFAPKGAIFPVSAAMLEDRAAYDRTLEDFSRRILPLIDYEIDPREGWLTVENETADVYRFFDATAQVRYLYEIVRQTVERVYPEELEFILGFDRAKREIQEIVDMPDRKLNLLVKLCLENGGRLSSRKRERFVELSDTELREIEAILQDQLPRFSANTPNGQKNRRSEPD